MAKTTTSVNPNGTKTYTVHENENSISCKRERAQIIDFAKDIKSILERNVTKNSNKSFTQYTKDLIKQYVQSPNSNQDTIREISRFLCRNSMIYQKLIMYYASMPLFNYTITPDVDITKNIDGSKVLKKYVKVLKDFEGFNIKKEGYTALAMAIRDGIFVGYTYAVENGKYFTMPLDVKYCRIQGKTPEGEWIVYFDAKFFDSGNNKEFVQSATGTWDDVFVNGYNDYLNNGMNYQWFRLPPERTCCLITCNDDEFIYPLPYFLPLFTDLLDLLDLQQLLQSRTELENYKLIVNKVPLVSNSDDVDDFAISDELAKTFTDLMEAVVPDLVGVVRSPMDIDTVSFENSNSSKDTDTLGKSIQNLFNNAGASQLVVAGGASSSSVGLNHAIQNDEATCWIWVDRYSSWLNFFIANNISEGYRLQIHRQTWYNEEDFTSRKKDVASLGGPALDYLTSNGDTPYSALQKIHFEDALGIKDMMKPLSSSYTQSATSDKGGAPKKKDSEISDSGIEDRDQDLAETTKAKKGV